MITDSLNAHRLKVRAYKFTDGRGRTGQRRRPGGAALILLRFATVNPQSEIRIPKSRDGRAGEVAREDASVACAARGRDVRARLAEAEAVAEARAAKHERRARARHV